MFLKNEDVKIGTIPDANGSDNPLKKMEFLTEKEMKDSSRLFGKVIVPPGSALAYQSSTSCSSLADYAIVSMHINDANALDGLQFIGVEGGDGSISVTTSGTHTINTIGVFSGGITGIVAPTDLTYTVTSKSGGTPGTVASSTGIYTAPTAAGTDYVEISVTTKPAISTVLQITIA